MTTPYLMFSTVLFFLLAIIWTRDSALNVLLKIVFFGGGAWGLILTLMNLGFVVRG